MLSCIVGLSSLDEGNIKVLGETLGGQGPRIGYMSQEISLVSKLTIKESIYYFGKLFGMKKSEIAEKLEYFLKLFELPDEDRLVMDCSGGQQRSVSLIVSVLHEPELIVLDEPTTGMDIILRQKMWDFLQETVKSLHTTILITTSYTEEARRADTVGIMRRGKLLAENTPQIIMESTSKATMEDSYLELCLNEAPVLNLGQIMTESSSHFQMTQKKLRKVRSVQRVKTMVFKNALLIFRNKL